MPRCARITLAEVPLHIVQRGHNRSACFFADRDYARYLADLRTLSAEFGCAVHAYCLMTNHVHLLLTPAAADGAALLMKNLGQRYVQYVNRTYGRSGTLWEGRFRSCLVGSEHYLLACHRYIELNPVRAAMVVHPARYRWSSYRANAEGNASNLLVPHERYRAIGTSEQARRDGYRALFDDDLTTAAMDEIRLATSGGLVLGSDAFRQEVAQMVGRGLARAKRGRPPRGDRQMGSVPHSENPAGLDQGRP